MFEYTNGLLQNLTLSLYLSDKCADTYLQAHKLTKGCRSFWYCNNGKSFPMCCPLHTAFVDNVGCVPDNRCNEHCPPRDSGNPPRFVKRNENMDEPPVFAAPVPDTVKVPARPGLKRFNVITHKRRFTFVPKTRIFHIVRMKRKRKKFPKKPPPLGKTRKKMLRKYSLIHGITNKLKKLLTLYKFINSIPKQPPPVNIRRKIPKAPPPFHYSGKKFPKRPNHLHDTRNKLSKAPTPFQNVRKKKKSKVPNVRKNPRKSHNIRISKQKAPEERNLYKRVQVPTRRSSPIYSRNTSLLLNIYLNTILLHQTPTLQRNTKYFQQDISNNLFWRRPIARPQNTIHIMKHRNPATLIQRKPRYYFQNRPNHQRKRLQTNIFPNPKVYGDNRSSHPQKHLQKFRFVIPTPKVYVDNSCLSSTGCIPLQQLSNFAGIPKVLGK